MKQHPETKTLIEPQNKKLWRIVERFTTARGFSTQAIEVEANFPNHPMARQRYEELRVK